MWSITSTFTLLDLADEADVLGVRRPGRTSNSEPSSPPRPTAGWPWRLSRTRMSELILPSSTIFATSTVSASETRRPSTNFTSIPIRSM